MSASDERFPVSAVEDNGLPNLDGSLPEDETIGEAQDRLHTPRDSAMASFDRGTTANEVRAGEPLDVRLAREEPDVLTGDPYPVEGERDPEAGRLVESDEGAREDTEKETTARDVGIDHGQRSAEEAAMHIVEEAPGAVYGPDSYLDDTE